MKLKKLYYMLTLSLIMGLFIFSSVKAQPLSLTKEQLIYYTSVWQGERSEDGRPKVSDEIIARLRHVNVTEAWQILNSMRDQAPSNQGALSTGEVRATGGYTNQYVGGMQLMRENVTIIGRALTAQFMPARPDLNGIIQTEGQAAGRSAGQFTWGVEQLQTGDCYVVNVANGILDASHVGDNLGTAIWFNSGNGAIIVGTVRDLPGNLAVNPNFNLMVRDFRPQSNSSNLMAGINCPIQVGYVTVMPGDIVLAQRDGVVFIPPQHALAVVEQSERLRLQDTFAHNGVKEGRFSARQADGAFTPEMHTEFTQWLFDHAYDVGPLLEGNRPEAAPAPEFILKFARERQERYPAPNPR